MPETNVDEQEYNNWIENSGNLSDQEYETQLNKLYSKHKGRYWGQFYEQELYEGLSKRRYRQLSDPNSQYYRSFQNQLRKNLMDTYSTDKLISSNRARGLSMTGSGLIAAEQRKAMEGRVNELAQNATTQMYYGMANQGNSLLSQIMGSRFNRAYMAAQQQSDDDKQWATMNQQTYQAASDLGNLWGDDDNG